MKGRCWPPARQIPDALERLRFVLQKTYEHHVTTRQSCGRAGGCPFGNLSGELMALDPAIREKLLEIFERHYTFYEQLLTDAQAAGQVSLDDGPVRARALFAFLQGMQMLAHTHNDPEWIRLLAPDAFRLIGAPVPAFP